jgi:hypothetical protein
MTSLLWFFGKAGDACNPSGGNFFGLPHWYSYLHGAVDPNGHCSPTIGSIADAWLIVAAIIEILLRIAAILAVMMIIYGAFSYVTSQGEADATKRARDTIVNALVGLAIAITSAAIIQFIAGSIS